MTHKIQLPNGLLDGADLFNYAEVSELKGKQQNYLANKDLVVGNIGHVPKILEDLIVSLETKEGLKWQGQIKDAVQKLSAGDLETILVKIREFTFGERYYFEAVCSHCGTKNKDIRINLNELALDVFPIEDMLDKSKMTMVLPKSGLEVEFKPLYMRDLFELIKIANVKHDELITASASLFIKRLGDKTQITSKDIEELPALDIMELNDAVSERKLEGTIDNTITNECSSCKQEFETKLNVYDPSFFVHTKGSKTSHI